MRQIAQRIALFFISLSYFPASYASNLTWGEVSTTATGLAQVCGRFLMACCFAIGFGMAMSAIMKYKYHRENPSAIPISVPIVHFLFGMALILLAIFFIYTSPYIFGADGGKLTVLDGVIVRS